MPEDVDGPATLTVCVNERPQDGISVSCGPRGGHRIASAVVREVAARGAAVEVATITCLGLCQNGPNIRLAPGNSWFHGVRPADVPDLVDKVVKHLDAHRSAT